MVARKARDAPVEIEMERGHRLCAQIPEARQRRRDLVEAIIDQPADRLYRDRQDHMIDGDRNGVAEPIDESKVRHPASVDGETFQAVLETDLAAELLDARPN